MDADEKGFLSLVGLNKVFDKDFYAVKDFNLEIKKGEFVTLLGPSGCGKTTTLRMIAGFQIPDGGKILLNGQDITDLPPYKRPVNTVFQHYALFPNLDVYDNIAFGLKLKKIPYETTDRKGNKVTKMRHYTASEIDEKVARALKIVDLEEMEDRDISNLSGGQQQRVAIARAIVNEPQVLLLDEPLSALDHKMRLDMQVELKEMHKKLGITFVYVTHDQEEALSMSDTIVVMKDGEIKQVGTPESIYNEPNSAYVADFIGESNIYNGVMTGEKTVRFLGANFPCVDEFPKNEKVDVVVRPEDVELVKDGEVRGTIVSKIFKGEDYAYVINVGRFEVDCRNKISHEVGSEVGIDVLPENIQIMKKDVVENSWDDSEINKENEVYIGEDLFPVDVTQLLAGSKVDEEGYLVGPDGKRYDLTNAPVVASCGLDDVIISDNLEEGRAKGTIISAVWIGDHYEYIIRTDDEEDYTANSPYQWNVGDLVSLDLVEGSLKIKLRKGLDEYVIS